MKTETKAMNLTEAETKEIRNDAKNWVQGWGVGDDELSFIAGATRMAEKKNERIEELEAGNLNLKSWNSILKEELESTQAEVKTWEGVAASRLREIAEIQSELERVKTVAEKMAKVIKLISETDHVHLASEARDGREALTEFANLMNKEK